MHYFSINRSRLVEQMKKGPFSLATDDSNDEGLFKLNPLLVRLFDNDLGYVNVQLLDMCCTKSRTTEILFENISNDLKSTEINWSSCVGLSLKNISVSLGRLNTIKTRVQEINNSIYINGCPCHILHNTVNKGAEMFMLESGFEVMDMLVDIFCWFDKSSKRKVELEEFCSFCGQEYRKIIKHVSTRWLSLETAVTQTLQLYQPLPSYFLSQEVRPNCLERLETFFADPMTEVFLFFLPIRFTKLC